MKENDSEYFALQKNSASYLFYLSVDRKTDECVWGFLRTAVAHH